MPTLPGGLILEQKVVTVANNDTAINAEITAQGANEWSLVLVSIYPDGTSVILTFNRVVPAT